LAVGDVFHIVKPVSELDRDGGARVELVVERITAYGRDIHEIDEGLTAELRLRGEGCEHVGAESVLVSG
jgi:hypothetical protein